MDFIQNEINYNLIILYIECFIQYELELERSYMQKKEKIEKFIIKLSAFEEYDGIKNPWKDPIKCDNLKKFFMQSKKPKYILIGEAPGRKGCLKCGVPFCDDYTLAKLLSEAKVVGNFSKETSAQRIYMTFKNNFVAWNVFPFQPCFPDGRNRTPSDLEISDGKAFLKDFLDIFYNQKNTKVILLGDKAKDAFDFPKIKTIEVIHPSTLADKKRLKIGYSRGWQGWLKYIYNLVPELTTEMDT